MKRSEVLTQATSWMDLEHTMVSGEADTEGHTFYMSIYKRCPEQANLQRQKQMSSAWAWGEGIMSYFVRGTGEWPRAPLWMEEA